MLPLVARNDSETTFVSFAIVRGMPITAIFNRVYKGERVCCLWVEIEEAREGRSDLSL